MRLPAFSASVLVALSASGCSGGGGSAPTASPTASAPTVTIAIVATAGAGSYSPNPVSAAAGASLAWRNNDTVAHRIAMDDGSGTTATIAPGATSAPLSLRGSSGAYHSTIHPSMVGSVNAPVQAPPSGGGGSEY